MIRTTKKALERKQKFWLDKPLSYSTITIQLRMNVIFCHICGGHRHYKGITGILNDGSRILFGKKCATDYFGPEVVNLHAAELRRRTSDAHARFKILSIKAALSEISEWLNSYRPLIQHCSQSWIEIKAKYPEPYEEILNHLSRNSGRFVQRDHVEIKSVEHGLKRMFQDTILGFVRSSNSIPYLTQISQQLSLVDAFIETIDSLRFEPSSQSLNNLNRMFVRMVSAATLVDASLAFTHDFFSPQKMAIVNRWAEQKRREKLGHIDGTSTRDVGKLFTKIMGSAFPIPPITLRDTILKIEPLKMLAQENGTFSEMDGVDEVG